MYGTNETVGSYKRVFIVVMMGAIKNEKATREKEVHTSNEGATPSLFFVAVLTIFASSNVKKRRGIVKYNLGGSSGGVTIIDEVVHLKTIHTHVWMTL